MNACSYGMQVKPSPSNITFQSQHQRLRYVVEVARVIKTSGTFKTKLSVRNVESELLCFSKEKYVRSFPTISSLSLHPELKPGEHVNQSYALRLDLKILLNLLQLLQNWVTTTAQTKCKSLSILAALTNCGA